MSRHSTSANRLDVNANQKANTESNPDGDQVKGDFKIFPEDLPHLMHHKKDGDLSAAEIEDYILELPLNGCSVVKESETEVGLDDLVGKCLIKIRGDMDKCIQLFADVSGMECEHLISTECSRQTDGSAVRDICIDEGVPANDKILVEDTADGHNSHVKDLNESKDVIYVSDSVKVDVEWHVEVNRKPMLDEASDFDFNSYDSKVLLTHHGESESEKTCLVSSDLKDKVDDAVIPEDANAYAEELTSKMYTVNKYNKQNISHQESVAEFEDATDTLICSSSTLEATIEKIADDSTVKASDMKADPGPEETKNPLLPSAVNNNEFELPKNVPHHQVSEQQNLAFDRLTGSTWLQRDHFESSFASVGTYGYAGSVAYSGSLSHRSDASTVSTRSFAFPVLQNEWNFSPVRMRKADRRLLEKRRGWMNGLFCCKF